MDGPNLYVIGAGGHGRELHGYLEDLRKAGWPGALRGYLDDGVPAGLHGRLNVLGALDCLALSEIQAGRDSRYIAAVGANLLRRGIVQRLEDRYGAALAPWSLVHPAAYVGEDVEIGEGACVAPGAVLTACTRIGRHSIINVRASVSHDCSVGDFVNINPAATVCGWVTVCEGAYIGAGAIIRDKVSIGAWSLIGAGAVVVRNIPANVTAVGVPARVVGPGLLPCQAPAVR